MAMIPMTRTLLLLLALGSSVLSVSAQVAPAAGDLNDFFTPVKWRSIGPFRGGRSVAATGVVGDPKTYYMGTTGGGLWKTDNMGISWRNVSDGFFKTGTVGAVAVAESDPNVVYVGMGEHAVRGVMTHSGDGVYRSTDAGKTWKHIGLDLTQHISRIIVHPNNPDIVYVAAQGALYSQSEQRGVAAQLIGIIGAVFQLMGDSHRRAAVRPRTSVEAAHGRLLQAEQGLGLGRWRGQQREEQEPAAVQRGIGR